MPRRKVIEVGGERYTVRALTFQELVKLGSANSDGKESKTLVAEVLHRCLLEPRLSLEQIAVLDDATFLTLAAVGLATVGDGLCIRLPQGTI